MISSSDGVWDHIEWKKARQLYQELWPGEPIQCPWEEVPNPESGHNNVTTDVIPAMLIKDNVTTAGKSLHTPENRITHSFEGLEPDEAPCSGALISLDHSQPNQSTVSQVDFTNIRNWLSHCEESGSHTRCEGSVVSWNALPGVRFRVLDLQRRCIVDAPDGCPYIALSYVWGGVDQLMLTSETESLLMRESGIDRLWSLIPLSILDAITSCDRLGERFLWVDALCIMQDAPVDKKIQILRMRQIYYAAKCTIVAVSADTAKDGLLGAVQNNGFEPCTSAESLDRLMDSSPWGRRAWCYQEKVLSHRAILFTSAGIYMKCQNGTYNANNTPLIGYEDGGGVDKFNTIGGMVSIPNGEELQSFISAVEHYSQRKLTKEEDKMNAFQGIFRAYRGILNGSRSSFCYGLPIFAFDQTFCWRSRLHYPGLRNHAFPSWSWLGWNHAVSFDRAMIQSGCTRQMIYDPRYRNDDDMNSTQLRKPAQRWSEKGSKFGFPVSTNGLFYNAPTRHLYGSVVNLNIAPDSVELDKSNGLFPVFSTRCSQQPRPTPPRMYTVYDFFTKGRPPIEWMDKETEVAPSVPAPLQSGEKFDLEHMGHNVCEAKKPVGYIWLDRKWRNQHPKPCVMEFLAIAGRQHVNQKGRWIITMLMCLQRMQKNGHFWAHERVQVMDCKIEEEDWLSMGAKNIDLSLT